MSPPSWPITARSPISALRMSWEAKLSKWCFRRTLPWGGRISKLSLNKLFFAFFASLAFFAEASHVPDQALIRLKPGVSVSDDWTVPGTSIVLTRRPAQGALGWELWELPAGHRIEEILESIRSSQQVESAEPNYIRHP